MEERKMRRRDFVWLGSASALAVPLGPSTGGAQEGRADLTAGGAAPAQTSSTSPPDIAAPKDVPFGGTIHLAVDATDVTRHIFRVTETIPVQSGRVTLLYPRWLPGTHAPGGRIDALAGLMIHADGRRLEWMRDTVDVYA